MGSVFALSIKPQVLTIMISACAASFTISNPRDLSSPNKFRNPRHFAASEGGETDTGAF